MSYSPENLTVVKTLADYLGSEIPALKEIFEEWPNNMEALEYPSLSIFTIDAKEIYRPPEVFSKTEITDEDDENFGKFKVKYNIGQINFSMQLDAWCSNKIERGDIYQKITDAFNKGFITEEMPLQLTLTLDNYHGQLVHYEILGYSYSSEPQLGSWRIRFNVNGDFEKIKEVIQSKINSIVISGEISESVIL